MLRHCLSLALLLSLMPSAGLAEIEVSFRDGAPKDRFTVTNTGNCPTGPMVVEIDMTNSVGKLIFDVTARGAGVQVFQPLEITAGAEFLRIIPGVEDGQTGLQLDLVGLPAGGRISFTIDVDDTIGQREITVSGSEMQGSAVIVQAGFSAEPGVFDDRAVARVETPGCVS
ncbi:aggregation factor core [Tropicimonas sp. S265A]|uniref:aggregation factor core n=1 Tax=Tropicimonas sp. S265A TaxID=3415134 RepID=UPI003C7BCBEF